MHAENDNYQGTGTRNRTYYPNSYKSWPHSDQEKSVNGKTSSQPWYNENSQVLDQEHQYHLADFGPPKGFFNKTEALPVGYENLLALGQKSENTWQCNIYQNQQESSTAQQLRVSGANTVQTGQNLLDSRRSDGPRADCTGHGRQ